MNTQQEDMLILGVDPGTNFLGYGLLKISKGKAEMVAMGVVDLHKYKDHYQKLQRIFSRLLSIIDEFHPTELAIEAPFFGKNVQSMLKLGRAQGVAMSAALYRQLTITEYAPLKVKMAITGNGAASKEQVADMLRRMLHLDKEEVGRFLDATDALAAAYCHFLQMGRPETDKKYSSWKDFVNKNKDRQSSSPIGKKD